MFLDDLRRGHGATVSKRMEDKRYAARYDRLCRDHFNDATNGRSSFTRVKVGLRVQLPACSFRSFTEQYIYIYYIYIVGNDTISSVQVGSSVTRMMLFHSPYRPFNCDRIVTGRNIEKIERFFVSLCYRAISTVISFFLRKQCRDDFSSKRFYQSYRSNGLENRSWKFVSCESRFRREVQRYLRICLHRWRIFI